jgi:hypothetical protein
MAIHKDRWARAARKRWRGEGDEGVVNSCVCVCELQTAGRHSAANSSQGGSAATPHLVHVLAAALPFISPSSAALLTDPLQLKEILRSMPSD